MRRSTTRTSDRTMKNASLYDRIMSGDRKFQLPRPEQRVQGRTLPYLGPVAPFEKGLVGDRRPPIQPSKSVTRETLKYCLHATGSKQNGNTLPKASQSSNNKARMGLQTQLVIPVGVSACSKGGPTDEHQVHNVICQATRKRLAGTCQATRKRVAETEAGEAKMVLGISIPNLSRKRQTRMLDVLPPAGFMRCQTIYPTNPQPSLDSPCVQYRMRTSSPAVASVRAALSTFERLRRKYQCRGIRRADRHALNEMKANGQRVYPEKFAGDHPGVAVGSEFKYRYELIVIGLHSCAQAGIDYICKTLTDGVSLAVSVVASGGYFDKEFGDTIWYSGEGGHHSLCARASPKDQKLNRGNLALRNNIMSKTPVRLIKGKNVPGKGMVYTYCGLYSVKNCCPHKVNNKLVYTFKLVRQQQQQKCHSFLSDKVVSPLLPRKIKSW